MKVAINGTGIAGPTLAYWLKRYGHEPVLFERDDRLRTEGFVVDFWGMGYQVAERMGIIDKLRARGKEMNRLSFVNNQGRELAGLDTTKVRKQWNDRFITVPRGIICKEIFDACGDIRAEFGTHITHIDDHGGGVAATLSDGRREEFDAIVGADGLHSAIRGMVFGPESEFEQFMDCYVAAYRVVDYPHQSEDRYVAHSIPNRWASRIQRYDGATVVLFIFRASLIDGDPDSRDVRDVLRNVYAGVGWEIPDMLQHLDDSHVYFDRVSQIHMRSWSKGRIALIGDAAACASLLVGEGTGLAMTEAYVLAGELHRADGDVELGFNQYQQRLAKFVKHQQQGAVTFRAFFAPKTRFGIWTRNLLVKAAGLPGLSAFIASRTAPSFELEDYEQGHPAR
jgi:2-polyprenyl-6-methoxyphenol hydroxylase-like FAD-dependent oxidoreductase